MIANTQPKPQPKAYYAIKYKDYIDYEKYKITVNDRN